MAKEIKTIKCPSCGSAKIKELRADYYQCESCGTEFFLDNNDININVNYNNAPNTNSNLNTPQLKKVRWIIGGIMVLSIFIPLFFNLFFPSHSSNHLQGSKYSWYTDRINCLFTDAQNNPYYVKVGLIQKAGEYNASQGVYIGLFNVKDSKTKWVKKLTSTPYEGADYSWKIFDDKNLYIIIGNKEVYRVDAATLTIENMTGTYEKNNPNLSIGIAKIKFLNDNIHGFSIITNEGKNVCYMPLINQIYNNLDSAKAAVPPNAVIKTYYTFDFRGEVGKLAKFKYKYGYGYAWSVPYRITNFDDYDKKRYHVIDYNIMLPDRIFFSPKVLDFDSARILIAYTATPADNETYICQLLDAQNGSIIKTVATNNKYINMGMLTKEGFMLYNSYGNGTVIYYDNNGKIINTIKSASDIPINEIN